MEVYKWFSLKENWSNWIIILKDGLKLLVIYFFVEMKSEKIVLVVYGYMGDVEMMINYVKMFYDMGYNVFVFDVRGYGKSEGDYIGFGWLECKDYV